MQMEPTPKLKPLLLVDRYFGTNSQFPVSSPSKLSRPLNISSTSRRVSDPKPPFVVPRVYVASRPSPRTSLSSKRSSTSHSRRVTRMSENANPSSPSSRISTPTARSRHSLSHVTLDTSRRVTQGQGGNSISHCRKTLKSPVTIKPTAQRPRIRPRGPSVSSPSTTAAGTVHNANSRLSICTDGMLEIGRPISVLRNLNIPRSTCSESSETDTSNCHTFVTTPSNTFASSPVSVSTAPTTRPGTRYTGSSMQSNAATEASVKKLKEKGNHSEKSLGQSGIYRAQHRHKQNLEQDNGTRSPNLPGRLQRRYQTKLKLDKDTAGVAKTTHQLDPEAAFSKLSIESSGDTNSDSKSESRDDRLSCTPYGPLLRSQYARETGIESICTRDVKELAPATSSHSDGQEQLQVLDEKQDSDTVLGDHDHVTPRGRDAFSESSRCVSYQFEDVQTPFGVRRVRTRKAADTISSPGIPDRVPMEEKERSVKDEVRRASSEIQPGLKEDGGGGGGMQVQMELKMLREARIVRGYGAGGRG